MTQNCETETGGLRGRPPRSAGSISQNRAAYRTFSHAWAFYPEKGIMAGRVCFPIHNHAGELVAYAGRWAPCSPKAGGRELHTLRMAYSLIRSRLRSSSGCLSATVNNSRSLWRRKKQEDVPLATRNSHPAERSGVLLLTSQTVSSLISVLLYTLKGLCHGWAVPSPPRREPVPGSGATSGSGRASPGTPGSLGSASPLPPHQARS